MKNLKKTLIIGAVAAAFSIVPAVSAQVTDLLKDQAADAAKDAVKDAAKEKALKTVKGTSYGSGAVDAVEKAQGVSDTAKSYGSGSKDGIVDAAKDKAKAYGSDKKDGTVEKAKAYGSDKKETATTYGSGQTATTTAAPVISCPAGTTSQPNGTCMITGNYQGGS